MEILLFVYGLAAFISVIILVLVIRFLWMVPNALREIANFARMSYFRKKDGDDAKRYMNATNTPEKDNM